MTDSAPVSPESATDSAPAPVQADNAARAPRTEGRRPPRQGGRGHGPRNGPAKSPKAAKPLHPVVAQLVELYPALFGPKLLPLKRGILHDLLAAHPEQLTKEGLKEALGLHTRSTRYLTAMASGQPRHDLGGNAVEAVAPEHQHHALLEVFKRKHQRTGQDVRAELRSRMVQAAEASNLPPLDYAQRVRTRDEAANAILDDAMADLASRVARDQALLQAFDASGKTVNEFADMYGLHPIEAAATLNRARARAEAPAAAPTPDTPATDATPTDAED
jgi:sRNA-binding protein